MTTNNAIEPTADMANAIRALSMDAVQAANSGHPGMPMGMADVATVLFSKFMKFDASTPNWADRDRFILSAGHGSMLVYSLLHLCNYPGMTMDELRNFRQSGAKTAGHPEYGHAEGIEMTTGPLGQGISSAVGFALAERMMAARFGDDLVDHYTYVIAGDGCLMEGISHEAIDMAGNLKLNKLIVLWDDNSISIDGATSLATCTDQVARFEASCWNTIKVDGHDMGAIAAAIEAAQKSDKPTLIACKTIIGFGSPNKQGTAATHGAPLGDEEIAATRAALGWSAAPFEVPADIAGVWHSVGARGAADRASWQKRLDASGKGADFSAAMAGELPGNFDEVVDGIKSGFSSEAPKLATRISSQKTLEVLNTACPTMISGSADLTGSNGTKTSSYRAVSADDFGGNYIHYGVREHAMAAMMNGISLHGGFKPYSGTFLAFADYSRGSIRLGALMGVPVTHVMTHDSIGLGEDGPTHQPVEHVASLRAIPNLNVFRPCDPVEVAESWALALKSQKTPSVLCLTRQGLATVRTDHTSENLTAKGAYILRDCDGERDVTLMATGSEVEIAVEAAGMLADNGIKAVVVSMPCWELFAEQDDAYKDQVLGSAPCVAVEAAVRMGWDQWIGRKGAFVGMSGFGASAPAPELYKQFGITADAVVEAARAQVK